MFKLIGAFTDINQIKSLLQKGQLTPTKLTQIGAILIKLVGNLGIANYLGPVISAHTGISSGIIWAVAIIDILLNVGHAIAPSLIPAAPQDNTFKN